MRFDILTIFPEVFGAYFGASILGRAQKSGIIEIAVHNIRDYATDKHKVTDDIPYGGGAGMVMKVEPIWRAKERITADRQRSSIDASQTSHLKSRTILLSAKGKLFTQRDADRLSRYERILLICGRYEGVDERVAEHIADEEMSVGEFVLTGGEVPAMAVVDAVARLVPGVLGNERSLEHESYSTVQEKEYPQYTRPEDFHRWKVPRVLLGGNHKEIQKWREDHSVQRQTAATEN